MTPTRFVALCATGWLLAMAPVFAAPPLPGDFIADLERLQQRLEQGETEAVGERARAQAERLAGGNAADLWARALYLQLLAGAEARAERPAEAAEHLREARETPGVGATHRQRWQRDEAILRLAAGDHERAVALLGEWLEQHPDETRDRWRLARALAELQRWERAAAAVDQALAATPAPLAEQRRLAVAIYRRAERDEAALALLADGLEASTSAEEWRQAAALAQRLGDGGRAAAIWEAGWRRGILSGREDLQRRIALHLAGGTPARAAELLERALAEGTLDDDEANRRRLAQAWEAARARKPALAAWQELAERTGHRDDWQRLGQLAHAWGEADLAASAFAAAGRAMGNPPADLQANRAAR